MLVQNLLVVVGLAVAGLVAVWLWSRFAGAKAPAIVNQVAKAENDAVAAVKLDVKP